MLHNILITILKFTSNSFLEILQWSKLKEDKNTIKQETLTFFTMRPKMGPGVLTNAFIARPQFLANSLVLTRVRYARRLAVFYDL